MERNAYGGQQDSFEHVSDNNKYPLIFIRAPKIFKVGEHVEILDALAGEPILVRQNNVTVATFHPELTDELDVYRQVFYRLEF